MFNMYGIWKMVNGNLRIHTVFIIVAVKTSNLNLWYLHNKTGLMVYEWYLMYRVFHNPEKYHEFMLVLPEVINTSTLISRLCMCEYALHSNSVNIPLPCHMCRIYVGFNSFIWWALVNMFPICRCRHLFLLSQGWVTVNTGLQL